MALVEVPEAPKLDEIVISVPLDSVGDVRADKF